MSKFKLVISFFFLITYVFSQNNNPQTKANDTIIYNENLIPLYISSLSDYRNDYETSIATSTIKLKKLSIAPSSYDLPELLNSTPSVYATKQGGGYGDSQITIRGFDQRNIAVLINGVPVNDMESGWVYWSNWMNLTDIATSIQVQRGLGASKLALPAIGGSINIYTKAAKKSRKTMMKFDYSGEGLFKQTLAYDTGIMDNNLAVSLLFSHLYGKGYVDMTQGEAYNYFLNLDYQLNDKNSLMFTIFGGPQWHNQRNKAPKLSEYLRYSDNAKPNVKYNQEWGFLKGKPYTWSRNYFHKPIASLNWNYEMNDQWELTSVLYGSWGKGGGSGPIGAINYNYPDSPVFINNDGQVRFDDIYTWNSGGHIDDFGADRSDNNGLFLNDISTGLTRYAFMNNHHWYGIIANIKNTPTPYIKWNAGLDMRYTSGKNTLTVNDVLGADAYFDNFDLNHPNQIIFPNNFVQIKASWNPFKSIEDLKKIVFYNQSDIAWAAIYGQFFYNRKQYNVFIQGSLSNQSYRRTDFFNLTPENQHSPWVSQWGGNLKAGGIYKLNNANNFYLNTGFFSKQPLFKAVFPKWNSNDVSDKIQNEKIVSAETGYTFHNNKYKLKLNLYSTIWKDRMTIVNDFINNQQVSGNLYGLTELHRGIETEGEIHLKPFLISAMISVGDWHYQGNIENVNLYNFQQQLVAQKNYYLNNVKVGNAPQFTANYKISYQISKKLKFTYAQFFVDQLYAQIDAANFSNPQHKGALKLPAYSKSDIALNYQMSIKDWGKLTFDFMVTNLFDKTYISESKTNFFPEDESRTWKGVNPDNRVFFGWGRNWNIRLKYEF